MGNEEKKNMGLYFSGFNDQLRNKIDLFLCQEALKLFEDSEYQTFRNWCNHLKSEILQIVTSKGIWVSKQTLNTQVELIQRLIDIFGFNADEGYYLVRFFFEKELFIEFEDIAIESNKLLD